MSSAIQYQSNLTINGEKLPPIENGESFEYLGKQFSFSVATDVIKSQLHSDLMDYIDTIEHLPLHSRFKIMIVTRYVYGKLRWRLTVNEIDSTWIKTNLDSLVLRFVRKWLQLHPGAHLRLPPKKFGLSLLLPSDIATSCKLTVRHILKSPRNNGINWLYSITLGKNVQIDEIVEEAVQSQLKNLKSSCDKRLAVKWEEAVWDRFMKLKKENCVMKALEHEVSKYRIKDWQLVSSSLPKNIFEFCRRGLILALPTNVNMCLWKMANSNLCQLCHQA